MLADLNKFLDLFYIPREIPQFFAKNILDLIYTINVQGTEKVPRTGGAVLVCNHTDSLDIPVQGIYFPRKVVFLGKNEIFNPQDMFVQYINSPQSPFRHLPLNVGKPILESLLQTLGERHKEQMRRWGGIPIMRNFQGNSAKDAVAYYEKIENQMVEIIRSGEILSIFPEGTRTSSGVMGPFKAMAAKVAIRANVPIIPSGISGAWNMSEPAAFLSGEAFRTKISYNIGNPIPPEQFPQASEKKAAKLLTEELEKRVYYLATSPDERNQSRRFATVL
ncbi:MAG: lysophospholipid acyltransferase family protein [Spirochaetota bacterium]